MSFYDIDYNTQGKLLLPPSKRLPKMLAWLYSLLSPAQWLRDWFFNVYIGGANYNLFDDLQYYTLGDRAVWFDNSVYECLNETPELGSVSSPILLPDSWFKIQDCFIGVDERLAYDSKIIVFEYALNRWFRNIGAVNQIYIVNNSTNGNTVLMANTSQYSMFMSEKSEFATSYLSTAYTPSVQYDYTIKVPVALFTTLGSDAVNRENAIRNIADKYNMAGMSYNVITF